MLYEVITVLARDLLALHPAGLCPGMLGRDDELQFIREERMTLQPGLLRHFRGEREVNTMR